MSRKQLRASEGHADEGLYKQFVMRAHTSEWVFAEVRMLKEVVRNVYRPKISRNLADLCSFFDIFKCTSSSIFRQFLFKISKTDFKIFSKINSFDIFVDIQKALLKMFV